VANHAKNYKNENVVVIGVILFYNLLIIMTLRELRLQLNENQAKIADYLKVSISEISNYENGISHPSLEDCILLNQYFRHEIEWNDGNSTPKEKHDNIQCVIELLQKFPAPVVSEFLNRTFKKQRNPLKVIAFYASQISDNIEPLYYNNQ
jgi:transcriptional regulator with XRE-family HTH domain